MSSSAPALNPLPVADVHLVMNAFNRLAARAVAQGGDEDPLLFALADYLRATLSGSTGVHAPLGQEAQALATLVVLEAETAKARIEFTLASELPPGMAPRGLLLAAAGVLLRARRPRSGGDWVMALRCEAQGGDRCLELGLRARGTGGSCDVAAAMAQLQPLRDALGPGGSALGPAANGLEGLWLRIPVVAQEAAIRG